MKKQYILYYLLSVILIVSYLYVLYLALNPQVSQEYKLAYIDGKLHFYPEKDYFDIQQSIPIQFGKEAVGNKYLVNGWSSPETEFVWSDAEESEIFFKLDKSVSNSEITVSVNASPITVDTQWDVSVYMNDCYITKVSFEEMKARGINFVVDSTKFFNDGRINQLKFEYSATFRPIDYDSNSKDNRTLALQIKSIEITGH